MTLFADDTVGQGLKLMSHLRVKKLPVVDSLKGNLVGEVTLAQLEAASTVTPRARIVEILSQKVEGPAGAVRDPSVINTAGLAQFYVTKKSFVN